MKSFLKYVLATFVALFIFSIIGFFTFFGVLGMMISSSEKEVQVKEQSVLVLNTGDMIPDRSPEYPMLSPMDFSLRYQAGLNDILRNLEEAATDPKIEGLYIKAGIMPLGHATTEELRQAILQFKESGKFVVAWSEMLLTQSSLFLSTVADEVYLNPMSNVEFTGLGTEIMFYKDALEKLGVEVQVIRHGTFKSAVEPFMQNKMSAANRRQTEQYLGSIWKHQMENMSADLGKTTVELNEMVDQLAVFTATDAMEQGVVNGLKYKDEIEGLLKEKSGRTESQKLRLISMVQYSQSLTPKVSGRDKIAVVYASGSIAMGEGTDMNIGASRFAESIRKAGSDSSVKALVLRINSPGGSALASEIIWRELDRLRGVKPVIVSMGNVAASGGYYIATTADKVYANPNTITGSIGVFGLIPQAEDLLKDKIGITTDIVKTNRHADFPSLTRAMSDYEESVMLRSIEQTYDTFITRVSEGRNMSKEEVDAIGQGRVWSGEDALEIGLIDEFGTLEDAIDEAIALAGVTEYRIQELPVMEDPLMKLMKDLSGEMRTRSLYKELGSSSRYYEQLKSVLSSSGVQMRLPFYINGY